MVRGIAFTSPCFRTIILALVLLYQSPGSWSPSFSLFLTESIYTYALVFWGYCCGCMGNTALLSPSSKQSIFRSEILAKIFSLRLDWWHSLYRQHSITITGHAVGWYRTALGQRDHHCSFLRFWSITIDLYSLGMEGTG